MPSSSSTPTSPLHRTTTFPPHTQPRTWLITSLASAIGASIAHRALQHGDNVVGGLKAGLHLDEEEAAGLEQHILQDEGKAPLLSAKVNGHKEDSRKGEQKSKGAKGGRGRLKIMSWDGR